MTMAAMTTTTGSKEEALALLGRARARLVTAAREIARAQCAGGGTTHARAVWDALEARGLLAGYAGRGNFLGAVFAGRDFEKVPGAFVTARSAKIHARPIPVWRLRAAPAAKTLVEVFGGAQEPPPSSEWFRRAIEQAGLACLAALAGLDEWAAFDLLAGWRRDPDALARLRDAARRIPT